MLKFILLNKSKDLLLGSWLLNTNLSSSISVALFLALLSVQRGHFSENYLLKHVLQHLNLCSGILQIPYFTINFTVCEQNDYKA